MVVVAFEIIGIIVASVFAVGTSFMAWMLYGQYGTFKIASPGDAEMGWQMLAFGVALLLGVEGYLIHEGFRHSFLIPEVIGSILIFLYLTAGCVGFLFGFNDPNDAADIEENAYYLKQKEEAKGRTEAKSWDWNQRIEGESSLLRAVYVLTRGQVNTEVSPTVVAERLGWKIGTVAEIVDALRARRRTNRRRNPPIAQVTALIWRRNLRFVPRRPLSAYPEVLRVTAVRPGPAGEGR